MPSDVHGDQRAAEQLGLLATEITRGLVYDWDRLDDQVFRSDELLELIGVPAEDAPGDTAWWRQRINDEDREEIDRRIDAAISLRAPTVLTEYRIRHRDGHELWVRDHARILYGPDGPLRFIGTVTDITARRRIETALHEREQHFVALSTSIDQGFALCEMVVDHDGRAVDYRFLEVNALFEQITGLAEATGRTALELVPELESHWVETYARVGLGGETLLFQNGSAAMGRWFDVFTTPVEPLGRFVIVFRDITGRRRRDDQLRESEIRFRTMADHAPVIVWVTEADGRCSYLNRRWHVFTGQPAGGGLGLDWLDSIHPEDREDTWRRFVAARDQQRTSRLEYRLRRHDGVYRWVIDSAAPRRSADGEVLGYIGSVIDITDRKVMEDALRRSEQAEREARARLELLADMVVELEGTSGPTERAERLVEFLVPEVADFAVVRLSAEPEQVRAAAHVDPSQLDRLRADHGGHPGGTPARDGSTAPPSLTLPLRVGDRTAGELVLGLVPASGRTYDEGDLVFLRTVADRVGLLLATALLREEEHRIAVRLQRALLPDRLVTHEAARVGARYEAASEVLEVGGDWYETFQLADGRIGVAVGDVVGHGLEAAAAMGRLRAALVALADHSDGPAQLLDHLDRFARGPGGASFATACCAVLDPTTGRLRYASAGHPAMLVIDPDGATGWLTEGRSLPLCLPEGQPRPEGTVVLRPGSIVVAYSDGLIERRGERFSVGEARLAAAARALRGASVDDLCDSLVSELSGPDGFEDDVVVLALELLRAPVRFERTLPAEPAVLAPLRADLRAWLGGRGIAPRDQTDVLLAVGEACSNAIEHAYHGGPPGDITVEVVDDGPELLAAIRDHGSWRAPWQGDRDRGRGSAIMRSVSTAVELETGVDGTTVRIRLPRPVGAHG